MATTTMESAIKNLTDEGLRDVVYTPDQNSYDDRVASYWSATARLKPWAIVQPRTTEEVSKVVKALVRTPGCNFAIRSGGHTAWTGASNIAEGVTIDLGLMNKTSYDPTTKIASLQPGGRWTEAYSELEKHGVMVPGGREGQVGIGGLLTGGGKTFYTCRVGFACDQVVNYEVVLADGSIVDANDTTHPDLFRVLKGGSNNFGIVTRFDMATFPAREIWDGSAVMPRQATVAVVDAFVEFCRDLTETPDSHVLVMWLRLPGMPEHIISNVLTSLDGKVDDKSLQRFLTIPNAQTAMKTTTVAKKLAEFIVPSGKEDTWFTLSFSLDARIVQKVADRYEQLVEELKAAIPDGLFTAHWVLQPLLKSFAAHSAARGGNMFGLDRLKGDSVLLIGSVEVETASVSASVGRPLLKRAIDDVESFAESIGGLEEFRYLNYCDGSQDPLKSYGEENVRKMKDASAKYDPTGVFQKRVPGGFKISKVR